MLYRVTKSGDNSQEDESETYGLIVPQAVARDEAFTASSLTSRRSAQVFIIRCGVSELEDKFTILGSPSATLETGLLSSLPPVLSASSEAEGIMQCRGHKFHVLINVPRGYLNVNRNPRV